MRGERGGHRGWRRRPAAGLAGLVLALTGAGCSSGPAAPPDRGPGPRWAEPAIDLGPMPADRPVRLTLTLREAHPGLRERDVAAVSTPGSPRYGRYLSPAQLRHRYGAPPAGVAHARRQLAEQGLTLHWGAGDAHAGVTGRAADVSRVFGVPLREFRRGDGRTFYRGTGPGTVPPALRDVVTGVAAPGNEPVLRTHAVRPGGMTPDDTINAYGARGLRDQGIDGSGQTVILFMIDGYRPELQTSYARRYNLPEPRITNHLIGGSTPPEPQGEADMDLMAVHALAPAAKLEVYTLATNSLPLLAELFQAGFAAHPRAVATASFGACELALGEEGNQQLERVSQAAAAAGITAFVSSGDSTGYECYGRDWTDPPDADEVGVSVPANLPSWTGVGGTRISVDVNGFRINEVAWHTPSQTTGTGGGRSEIFPAPDWQRAPGTQTHAQGRRQVPDIAAVADPTTGMAILQEDGEIAPGGGTSLSAPVWAGLITLVNDYLQRRNLPPVGFLNPKLYRIASDPGLAPALNDITVGSNGVFPAGPGYDPVTGLGTPNATNLARALESLARGPDGS
jgi:kumamolisin